MGAFLAQCIRSRWAGVGCLAVVALSLLLPPGGFGIPMCQFRATFHVPCLACGLTRSFIRMAHLHWREAAFYHPLGLVLFPLTLAMAGTLPLPASPRERLAVWAEKHGLLLNILGGVLLAASIAYGFARIAWVLRSNQPSPW